MAVRLQSEPFSPGALLDAFCEGRRETGAVVSFTGLVRGEDGVAEALTLEVYPGVAEALTLEAYPGFTEAEIARAEAAAQARFSLQDSLIVHRHGRMRPGEAIVFVAAAAAHRRAAFEGADCLMDYLKTSAPFWKRSAGPEGERWIEPTPADHRDAARWSLAPAAGDLR